MTLVDLDHTHFRLLLPVYSKSRVFRVCAVVSAMVCTSVSEKYNDRNGERIMRTGIFWIDL